MADHVRLRLSYPPGIIPRQGTSGTHPTRVPSLIGIEDIRYLDSTGSVRHRSIADLMRYAIVNMGLHFVAQYGDFQPAPDQSEAAEPNTRYSDEQLYALALYLYSLKPPANPNVFAGEAVQGQKVFARQGCPACHTPRFYTNNKLTPALGFTVPQKTHESDAILRYLRGTDPTLALKTRRGTGYYKVPSLRGVWMRHGFGHGGEAATLEEWFDAARLTPGYRAQGFQFKPGPIQGREFGLKFSAQDKNALLAFLRTL